MCIRDSPYTTSVASGTEVGTYIVSHYKTTNSAGVESIGASSTKILASPSATSESLAAVTSTVIVETVTEVETEIQTVVNTNSNEGVASFPGPSNTRIVSGTAPSAVTATNISGGSQVTNFVSQYTTTNSVGESVVQSSTKVLSSVAQQEGSSVDNRKTSILSPTSNIATASGSQITNSQSTNTAEIESYQGSAVSKSVNGSFLSMIALMVLAIV